jgi:RHS repeat-associated protein
MPGRKWKASDYRYSHNGQEREDEIYAGAQSAEYWMYDSRIGRRWEIDPLTYEWQSPYAAFNNNPIYYADPSGLEGEGTDPDLRNNQKIKPPSPPVEKLEPRNPGSLPTDKTEPELRDPGLKPLPNQGAAPRDNTAVAPKTPDFKGNGNSGGGYTDPFQRAVQGMWRVDNWATSFTDRLIIWGSGLGNNPNTDHLKRTGGLYKTIDFAGWIEGITAMKSTITGNNYVHSITNNGEGFKQAKGVGAGIGPGWVEGNTQPAGIDSGTKPAIQKIDKDTVVEVLMQRLHSKEYKIDTIKTTYDKSDVKKNGITKDTKKLGQTVNGKSIK